MKATSSVMRRSPRARRTCIAGVAVGLVAAALVAPSRVGATIRPHVDQRAGVILWNKLDDANAVRRSAVGPNGVLLGGSFVKGRFGGAYQATHDQDDLVRFPFWSLNRTQGTIEFWARLVGWPSDIEGGGGNQPAFVEMPSDPATSNNFSLILYLTDNDGAGGGGLSAFVGHNETASGEFGGWSYKDVLGPDVGGWHHYALAWNVHGIPGIGNGHRRLATFVDGRLASSFIAGGFDGRFPGFDHSSTLDLLSVNRIEHGTTQIDNLITWNCAITDFSARNIQRPMARLCARG